MKIAGLLFFFLLITAGCSDKDRIPNEVLPKEKMGLVLWDMLQADEFLRDFMLTRDTTLDDTLESVRMYERVFRMHNTNREQFDTSFNFYRTHPVLLKEILDTLNARNQQQPAPTGLHRPQGVDTNRLKNLRKALRPD